MAYTRSVTKTFTTPDNFGGLVTDGNRVAMTGAVGSFIQTQDATGTPITSPATVNTTATLVVPNNAVTLTISPVTNPVQVSEDSTMSAYFAVPAAAVVEFDVARQQNVYLKTGGSTVVSFFFKVIT